MQHLVNPVSINVTYLTFYFLLLLCAGMANKCAHKECCRVLILADSKKTCICTASAVFILHQVELVITLVLESIFLQHLPVSTRIKRISFANFVHNDHLLATPHRPTI